VLGFYLLYTQHLCDFDFWFIRRAVLVWSIYVLKYSRIYYDVAFIKIVIDCNVCEVSHFEYEDLFP